MPLTSKYRSRKVIMAIFIRSMAEEARLLMAFIQFLSEVRIEWSEIRPKFPRFPGHSKILSHITQSNGIFITVCDQRTGIQEIKKKKNQKTKNKKMIFIQKLHVYIQDSLNRQASPLGGKSHMQIACRVR